MKYKPGVIHAFVKQLRFVDHDIRVYKGSHPLYAMLAEVEFIRIALQCTALKWKLKTATNKRTKKKAKK